MRIRNKILILLILFIVSCRNEPEKINSKINTDSSQTFIFSNYLQKKFNISIAKNHHCYIVIPETGCNLCINSTVESLLGGIESVDTARNSFIISNGLWFNDSILNSKIHYLIDKTKSIDELDLHIVNVTLIYTSNSKIDSIKSISSENTDKILSYCLN